jgi:hypothetical protein
MTFVRTAPSPGEFERSCQSDQNEERRSCSPVSLGSLNTAWTLS